MSPSTWIDRTISRRVATLTDRIDAWRSPERASRYRAIVRRRRIDACRRELRRLRVMLGGAGG